MLRLNRRKSYDSTCYLAPMNELDLWDFRRKRLLEAIDHLCQGDRTAFARRLGYRDGAFIRQMLSGTRNISERTVHRIERLPGMRGWFDWNVENTRSQDSETIKDFHNKRAAVVAERYVCANQAAQRVVDLVLRGANEPAPVWATRALVSAVETALAIAEASIVPEAGHPKRLRR